ncbi:formate hydrogenlyase [bacterium]|nr:MAG: formate hydrogenlyase [bacterium]
MPAAMQVLAIVVLAPLVQGAMKRLRARLQEKPGPPILQPYRDLAKLWTKEAVLPEGVSIIALCAPGVSLGVALTFAAALPFVDRSAGSIVDIVALAFLLGLGRFVLALAALDMRSAFTGMAASREMTFASLVEPALLIALLGGAALGRGTSFASLHGVPFGLAGALAFGAFFLLLLAETARVPIDNQETHYELTMIHEGLLLEYAGWQLAMLQAAAYVRQLCFLLLAAILLPGGFNPWAAVVWIVVLAGSISVVETAFAKLRLFEIPQLLVTALLLAVTSIGLRLLGVPV